MLRLLEGAESQSVTNTRARAVRLLMLTFSHYGSLGMLPIIGLFIEFYFADIKPVPFFSSWALFIPVKFEFDFQFGLKLEFLMSEGRVDIH